MDRGWNSYKLIKAWLVLPSPAAEHSQMEAAALQCLQELLLYLSTMVRLLLKGESCMSQFRSESCACSGLPKGVLRGKCFPSGKGLDWIPGHWKKYTKRACLSWDERVRGVQTTRMFAMCMEAQAFILLQNVQDRSI